MSTSSAVLSVSEKSLLQEALRRGLRTDARGWLDLRQVTIDRGLLPSGWGSARVRLGETELVVGVKVEVVDEAVGSMRIEVEGVDSSADFDRLQARIEDILGYTLNLEALLVAPGRGLRIHVDALVFHNDGNLAGAMGLAIKTALADTTLPHTKATLYEAPPTQTDEMGDDDFGMKGLLKGQAKNKGVGKLRKRGQADTSFELDHANKSRGQSLDGVDRFPLIVSIAIVSPGPEDSDSCSDILYLDPTIAEESASDANLLVAPASSGEEIYGISLSTNRFLSISSVLQAIELARQTASEIDDATRFQALRPRDSIDTLSSFLTT